MDLDPVPLETARARLPNARLICGDALKSPPVERADLVLMNPPYVGEKGNAALFAQVAALGSPWTDRTVARMDYLYYFVHLGLDLLRPGGRLLALTTAYWPSATSASKLRGDILARGAVLRWVRFEGRPVFPGAPGQHNLAVIIERSQGGESCAYGWSSVRLQGQGEVQTTKTETEVPAQTTSDPWQPFVTASDANWVARVTAEWPLTLHEVAQDRQGVVSGCDRTKRHHDSNPTGANQQADRPVFLLGADEVRSRGWHRDPTIRPLLEPLVRGSEIAPWQRLSERRAPEQPGVYSILYLDGKGAEPPSAVLQHLEPARAVLERRREVRLGIRPWWALHWPRQLEQMRRPKLITARRGSTVRFCLDLAGHVVSSDCTFLLAHRDDIEMLWHVLHRPDVERMLRSSGKRKGALLEFYSEPLRALRIPVCVADDGHLVELP